MWHFRNKIGYVKKFGRYCTISKPAILDSWQSDENLISPKNLSKKKHKYTECIYINSPEGAQIIAKNIFDYIPQNSVILEVNPGNGFLTKHFVNNPKISKVFLFETNKDFISKFEVLQTDCPNRVKIKHGDFLNLWKLFYRDNVDNKTRVADLLSDIAKANFKDVSETRIVGCVAQHNFFKHLIYSVVFNTGLFTYGRFEMYLVVPPPLYIHLTCNRNIGYLYYRAMSALFQILFEYKFICKIPNTHFLPTLYENSSAKKFKKKRIETDSNFLYLVKIVPRKDVYELCSLEDMPALSYFIKQTFFSRKNRVIPTMEKWAPGCGPKLIINNRSIKPVTKLFKEEIEENLPTHSTPCTTMSTEDYFHDMNIYTEFGELSPSQMLTLFLQFRNWPEYKESPFLASLESSLLKMGPSSDENIDTLDLVEEDDIKLKISDKIL